MSDLDESASDEARSFAGTDRFEVVGQLGRGGMGVVYEVNDRERHSRAALKFLPQAAPAALFAFKQEFRTLADVSHPNLVRLYELFSDHSDTYFTMEFIDGVDLMSYLHGCELPARIDPDSDTTGSEKRQPVGADVQTVFAADTSLDTNSATTDSRAASDVPALDADFLDRLRLTFRQLATGLSTIHAQGLLHRDIKPQNIMVESDGRLVVLDFGLAQEVTTKSRRTNRLTGTVAYMSPEQSRNLDLTPASDWYSVGVLLYEALTGERPFEGSATRMLLARAAERADPPKWLNAAVPDELNALVVDLLERNPDERAGAREILAWCGAADDDVEDASVDALPTPARSPFVGRSLEVQQMRDAFESVREGQTAVVMVRGNSGAGKSALVDRFLETLPGDANAVTLRGRCYEQESVPFKAFDNLVDGLTRYLEHVPENELAGLLPRDVTSLARIFPVVNRIAAVRDAPSRTGAVPDQVELRRRGFAALRELLARIGDRRPLILLIDDLQWGDVDSAGLFADLVKLPDPPVMLVIGTNRIEDESRSACLRLLSQTAGTDTSEVTWQTLTLSALTRAESVELARRLLADDDGHPFADAEQIVRESAGSPYFLTELAQHVRDGLRGNLPEDSPALGFESDVDSGSLRIRLDDALWTRMNRLPEDAARLLRVLSVASRPIALGDALAVADASDVQAALVRLRTDRFVRISGNEPDEVLAPYHDRIRETMLARLPDDVLRDHHQRLAETLAESGRADAQTLAVHKEGAGQLDDAGRYYAEAAEEAGKTLAFDQAATLYRRSLELRPLAGQAHFDLLVSLADALANAGRGVDAAEQYLAAAELADGELNDSNNGLMLRSQAGFNFCAAGEIDAGREALGQVLDRLGMPLPRTRTRALISLLINRVRFIVRGIRFRETPETELSTEAKMKLDVTWLVACSLYIHDTIRGADFSTRNMLAALKTGEPYRVARSLAWDATHAAMEGVRSTKKCCRMLDEADRLAERLQHPHAQGMAMMGRGVSAFFLGQWREANEVCDRATVEFTERCTGVAWELDTSNAFAYWALFWSGDFAEIQRRYPRLVAEAQQRGDRMAIANLTTFAGPFAFLSQDDPNGANDALAGAMGKWSQMDFLVQHFTTLSAQTYVAQYGSRCGVAWDNMLKQWPQLKSSFLLQVECVRIYMEHLRAACAIAAARELRNSDPSGTIKAGDRDWSVADLEAEAARYVRRLKRERAPYAHPMADMVNAALAFNHDDVSGARERLRSAAARLRELDTHMYAASAEFQLARLEDSKSSEAEQWIRDQNVVRPDLIADLFAPGFAPAPEH